MELAQHIFQEIESGTLDRVTGAQFLAEIVPDDIAITGMSCEYTGASDVFAFERLLRSGRNGFIPFPEERKDYLPRDIPYLVRMAEMKGTTVEEILDMMCSQRGPYLVDVDRFDYEFFGLSREESVYIDPMHRLMLNHLFGALEHAGITRKQIRGTKTAVYVGKDRSISGSYASEVENDSDLINAGTWEGILASRLNYLYDLHGGSFVIDTACSSSLVAAHLACKTLRDGEIDTALVGGIALGLAPRQGEVVANYGGVETVNDYLAVFDNASSGTIFGEGVGVVVLKRLWDALQAGDKVYAVVRATGINSDGRSNGLTAPNPKAQTHLIADTYRRASISPTSVDYIDAHGTGTKLGDPIEVRGLTDAFRLGGDTSYARCALTTLKENVGHTVGAAGVGGMIKMALALTGRTIFPSSSFTSPNDLIKFAETPFYVPTQTHDWPKPQGHPRRGGVSSFGFSGTNAHAVLEEYPDERPSDDGTPPAFPFLLSAPDLERLQWLVDSFVTSEDALRRQRLGDIAFTLAKRRERHRVRIGFMAASHDELMLRLRRARQVLAAGDEAPGVFLIKEATTSQDSAAATLMRRRVAEHPEFLSAEERLQLALDGDESIWDTIDFGQAIVTGLPGLRLGGERLWAKVMKHDIYGHSGTVRGEKIDGVLLDTLVMSTPAGDLYSIELSSDRWFIADHRIAGLPTLSGTGYVQLASEIAKRYFGASAFHLTKIVFKNLIQVPEPRTVYVQVQRISRDHVDVEVFSNTDSGLTSHASFQVRSAPDSAIGSLKAPDDWQFGAAAIMGEDGGTGALGFSGRWDTSRNTLRHMQWDTNRHGLELTLAPEFIGDVEEFAVSPAILDLLAGVMSWERGTAVNRQFLPLSYGRLVYTGAPMTAVNRSVTDLKYDVATDPRVISADVAIFNSNNDLVLFIERYSMRDFDYRTEGTRYMSVEVAAHGQPIALTDTELDGVAVIGEKRDVDQALSGLSPQERERIPSAAPNMLADLGDKRFGTIVLLLASIEDPSAADFLDFFELAKAIPGKMGRDGHLVVVGRAGLARQSEHVDAFDYARGAAARILAMENPGFTVTVVSNPTYDISTLVTVGCDPQWSGRRVLICDNSSVHCETLVPVGRSLTARIGIGEGAVLVTGAFGGMGTEYLEVLWRDYGVPVIALGRRCLEDLAQSDNEDDRRRAAHLKALVEEGFDLQHYCVDLEDLEALTQTLDAIDAETTIDAVVHLAGVAEDSMIFRKTADDFSQVVNPKACAAGILVRRYPDARFFVTSSSMTTLLGAPGQFGYTLANSYLEGLARSGAGVSVTRWPGWKETGMAVRFGADSAPDDSFVLKTLTTSAASLYVEMSLSRDYADLIAGEPTEAGLKQISQVIDVSSLVGSDTENGSMASTPTAGAPTDFVIKDISEITVVGADHPLDDLETFITVLFASALNLDEVDVTQSFTDMGGDSLVAFSIYTPLVDRLKVDLEVADIFVYPTVVALSDYVRGVQND